MIEYLFYKYFHAYFYLFGFGYMLVLIVFGVYLDRIYFYRPSEKAVLIYP